MALSSPEEAKGLLLPRLEQVLLTYQRSGIAFGYRIRHRYGESGLDIWIVGGLALLFILVMCARDVWFLALLFSLVALFKVIEVLLSCLSIVFTTTIRERGIGHPRRSLFLVLLNLGTIGLAFAGADRWLALAWPNVFTFRSNDQLLSGADQFLYLSWTTMTTLGNNYSIASTWSQALVVSEVVSGLLLLTVIVGCLMTLVKPELRSASNQEL